MIVDTKCAANTLLTWHAVDVDMEAIGCCTDNLRQVDPQVISHKPPLPLGHQYFDAVFCFSVFTHLDETLRDKWIKSLGEVIRPGGVLLLTGHGNNAAQRGLDQKGPLELLSAGFLHLTSSKLREWA